MSVDRTLHIKSGIAAKRNVLRRSERIALMTEEGRFDPETDSALGLRKTRVRHARVGGKSKKEEKPAEATEETAAEEEASSES